MEKIYFNGSSVFFDDKELKFPASYKEMVAVLGEPDRVYEEKNVDDTIYIYDELGISFENSSNALKRLKYLKRYVDNEHCLIYFNLCFRDKSKVEQFCEDTTPTGICGAKITRIMDIDGEAKTFPISFMFDRAAAGHFSVIAWRNSDTEEQYKALTESPEWNCSVSYNPPSTGLRSRLFRKGWRRR